MKASSVVLLFLSLLSACGRAPLGRGTADGSSGGTSATSGASGGCLEDRQCNGFEFCFGSGCSGPGGCIGLSSGACGGELKPVCGCDGRSYTNAGCAAAAGVRTAHDGVCAGADAGL